MISFRLKLNQKTIVTLAFILGFAGSYLAYALYFKPVRIDGLIYPIEEDVVVKRDIAGQYMLEIRGIFRGKQIRVYAGPTPESIDETKIIREGPASLIKISHLPPDQRFFFKVVDEVGIFRIVSERLIPLQGTCNFRDLGGYQTQDGRFVRWAKLFRADNLSELTTRDYRYLQSLRLKTLIDLRGPEEVRARPNRFPLTYPLKRLALPIYDPSQSLRALLHKLRRAKAEHFRGEKFMEEGYRQFVHQFKQEFGSILREITESPLAPLVYHCTGGKDRTGFASALILWTLGVPKGTIMQDYLASNYYRRLENSKWIRQAALMRISPEVLTPILEVRAVYLEAALTAIEEEYGSVEAYLAQELGINQSVLDTLRRHYLWEVK